MKAFVIEQYKGGYVCRFVEGKMQLDEAVVVPELKDAFREAELYFKRAEVREDDPLKEVTI